MKKVLAILIALAMVFSMAGVVSADGETQDITYSETGGNTEVTLTTSQGYIVTIPTKVSFSEGSLESANSVRATNVMIADGALLEVTVMSPNTFNLVYGSGLTVSKIPYSVTKYDGSVVTANNNVVLQVASNVRENSADLTFSTTEENVKMATMSGEHKDTLEFTVAVKEAQEGTTEEPSVIYIGNKPTLLAFADAVNKGNTYEGKTVMLTAEIDLEGEDWTPIGVVKITDGEVDTTASYAFKGTFDGQGHTISNMNVAVTSDEGDSAGLFGFVVGTVKNVKLEDVTVSSNHYAGAVVGYSYNTETTGATIENCHVIGGTITSTPHEVSVGEYDNGDKVGGIIGHSDVYDTVDKCSVTGVTIRAYRDIGGIAGLSAGTVTNNVVKDVTLIQDNTTHYKNEPIEDIHEIIGDERTTTVSGNTYENVEILKGVVSVSTADELTSAVTNGATTIFLAPGEYDVSDCGGKTLTLYGTKDVVLKVMNEGEGGCDYGFDKSTVTFNGLTIDANENTGWESGYARMTATYKSCIINGEYSLYGVSTFEACALNIAGDSYNIRTWGAPTATFTGCTFNSDGKAMLLYGQANTKLTLTDCTFNDNGGLTDLKAAVEIGNDYGTSYELIVNNCVVNGYEINDKGINTETTLWGNKDSMPRDKLNVVVDGVDVY